jgi:hypothetical protein
MSSGIGAIAAALIGAGGAVIGGTLTSGAQIWAERRQATQARQAQERQRTVEWRQAARLILEELADDELLIRQAVAARRFWERGRQLYTGHWGTYSPRLAAILGEEPDEREFWSRVAAAFHEVDRLNWLSTERWRIAEEIAERNREADLKLRGYAQPPRARIYPLDRSRASWRAIRAGMRELERSLSIEPHGPTDAELEKELWPYGDEREIDADTLDVEWFDPAERWLRGTRSQSMETVACARGGQAFPSTAALDGRLPRAATLTAVAPPHWK